MKTTQIALVLALLVPFAATACSGAGTNVATATAQEAATKAPLTVQVDGPLRTVVDAFAEVPLRPAQRTEIESLITASVQRHKVSNPGKEVMLELASQIEKGSIDEAALKTKMDASKAAMDPIRAEDHKAIQRVHDLLDASQRTALVDSLEAKRGERFGHHGDKAKEDVAGAPNKEHGFRHGGGMGFGMMKELNLTADQQSKIQEAMKADMQSWKAAGGEHKDHAARADHEKRENPLEAFKADTFDANKALSFGHEGHEGMGPERMIHMAKVVTPILTPEQRATAAKLIRDHADGPKQH
jgi:Spy/CpxP family protein refolding chaperone